MPTTDPRELAILTAVTTISMPLTLWAFAGVYGYGYLSAAITTVLALASIAKMRRFAETGERKAAISIFKFASPIIAVAFILVPLERAFMPALLA